MRKVATIKLCYIPGMTGDVATYRVIQVTDDVDYHPGQVLAKHEVRAMCKASYWKVTIVGVE